MGSCRELTSFAQSICWFPPDPLPVLHSRRTKGHKSVDLCVRSFLINKGNDEKHSRASEEGSRRQSCPYNKNLTTLIIPSLRFATVACLVRARFFHCLVLQPYLTIRKLHHFLSFMQYISYGIHPLIRFFYLVLSLTTFPITTNSATRNLLSPRRFITYARPHTNCLKCLSVLCTA